MRSRSNRRRLDLILLFSNSLSSLLFLAFSAFQRSLPTSISSRLQYESNLSSNTRLDDRRRERVRDARPPLPLAAVDRERCRRHPLAAVDLPVAVDLQAVAAEVRVVGDGAVAAAVVLVVAGGRRGLGGGDGGRASGEMRAAVMMMKERRRQCRAAARAAARCSGWTVACRRHAAADRDHRF